MHTQLASCMEIAGQTSPFSKQGAGHPFCNVFSIRYYILSNLWKHLSPFDFCLMWTSNGDPFWWQGGHTLYKALQEKVSCKAWVFYRLHLAKAKPQSLGIPVSVCWPCGVQHNKKWLEENTVEKQEACSQTARELFEWDSPETATQSFGFPQSQQMVSTSLWSLILLSWDERNFSTPKAGSNPPSCL